MKEETLNIRKVIQILKDVNIDKIVIHYSGGGDSGAIDDINFTDKDDNEIDGWDRIDEQDVIKDAIEAFIYPKLDSIEDWWNNEGGEGTAIIDLNNHSYVIDNEVRYYSYEHYKHTGSIQSLLKD